MNSLLCRMTALGIVAIVLAIDPTAQVFAGPRVGIVVGEKAPALEKLAADELASQLKRIYEAEVKIGSTVPADSPHVIFVGSPDTNASMKPFADSWPLGDKKLTDQGHLLRSIAFRDRSALLVGGGSPVATYWAVAEFGHRLGVRSMLFGDLDPVSPPPFGLEDINIVREPMKVERGWHFLNHRPTDSGAWGLDEYRRVLKQLSRLKFNRVTLEVDVGAPFVHFEYGGIKRRSAVFWLRDEFPVSGDTAGRKVFGGAKMFENPDFAGTTTYEQRIAAGVKLLNGVIDAAHEVGMTVSFQFSAMRFPVDFGEIVGYGGGEWGHPVTVDGVDFHDEKSVNLLKTQLRAYFETYPNLDGVELRDMWDSPYHVSEARLGDLKRASSGLDFWKRPNGRTADVRVEIYRGEAIGGHTLASLWELDHNADPAAGVATISFDPSSRRGSRDHIMPMFDREFPQKFYFGRQFAPDGYIVAASGVSDLDLPAYWLSRYSFGVMDGNLYEACRELLDPVCGEGVAECVWNAMDSLAHAENEMRTWPWIAEGLSIDARFGSRLESVGDPEPQAWNMARDHYLKAMNEMYRANTRAREGGRAYTLYWARRCEFAFEYMNCLEALRKVGLAKRLSDPSARIVELEKAVESINNGLNALAAVARSNSDRGAIAVMNANYYRPLKKKLAEAETAK